VRRGNGDVACSMWESRERGPPDCALLLWREGIYVAFGLRMRMFYCGILSPTLCVAHWGSVGLCRVSAVCVSPVEVPGAEGKEEDRQQLREVRVGHGGPVEEGHVVIGSVSPSRRHSGSRRRGVLGMSECPPPWIGTVCVLD